MIRRSAVLGMAGGPNHGHALVLRQVGDEAQKLASPRCPQPLPDVVEEEQLWPDAGLRG